MNQMWLVARREFRQRVYTRGFVLASIATPLILILIWAFTGNLGGAPQGAPGPVELPEQVSMVAGYVDQAGLIERVSEVIPAGLFQAFADVESANAALREGRIDAYYVIPADYREEGKVRRVSLDLAVAPGDRAWVNWLLAGNVAPDAGPEDLMRLRNPFNASQVEYVALNEADDAGGSGNSMLPFIVTMAVMAPLFTGGSLLLQSLAQEKGSRVMEVLLVSLRPRQLLAGKLLGLGAVIALQYLAWAMIGLLALAVAGGDALQFLSQINLSASELLLALAFALGGFTLYAGLMAGIGALAKDMESSRSWVFVISLPMMVPIYLWMGISSAPNGALAVVLSLFPFSAPVAMLMRMTTATVPSWQVAVSLILLLVTAVVLIRVMARLFRVQTLLSGEALSLKRMWAALRH